MSKYIYPIIFVLIICVAIALRVYNLADNPPGLYTDEAAIGFNAYIVGLAGVDEYKSKYPVFFRSFGDYRLPMPIYANVPSLMYFGLNEFAVRFTSAVFGILSIIFMMLTIAEIFGLASAVWVGGLLAISPWHIQMSRMGIEYVFWLGTFPIGLYFLIKSFQKPVYLILTALFYGLSLYTYYPTLFVTPLFLAVALALLWRNGIVQKNLKISVLAACIFVILCLPLISSYRSGILMSRWRTVSYKKYTLVQRVRNFASSYLQHFTLNFLFLKGDSGLSDQRILRHSVLGVGEMYLFELPLVLTGLYLSIKKAVTSDWRLQTTNFAILMLWLLLLFPTGSAVLTDGPSAIRSVIGVLPLALFSALGAQTLVAYVWQYRHGIYRWLFALMLLVVIGLSVFDYTHKLFYEYPTYADGFTGWFYGYGAVVKYLSQHAKDYDSTILLAQKYSTPIFFRFYDPFGACKRCIITESLLLNRRKHQLFAGRIDQLLIASGLIFYPHKTIYYHNGAPAYLIGAFGPASYGRPLCLEN